MEDNDEFTMNDLASKWRSKTKLYNILSRDGQLYLPPLQDATQKILRSLMLVHKKCLKCSGVKVVKISQYEELRVKNILKFAENLVDIDSYTPKYDYPKEPNREWLCNIINSLIPVDFKAYIDQKIKSRKRKSNPEPKFDDYCKERIYRNLQGIKICIISKGEELFLGKTSVKI